MAAEQIPDLSQLSEDERRQVLLVLQKAKASSTSVVLIRKRKQFNRRIEFVCELEIYYLSSINHEPSILTMRRDGQKRKIIRKMCI